MRFWQLFVRNLKETYRDPLALILMLVLPLLLILILRLVDLHVGFLAPIVTSFGLLVLIATSALWALRDRKSGFLSRMRATPTPPRDFILGCFLSAASIAVVEAALLLLCAWIFGIH